MMVAVILQYVSISNQHVEHLKLTECTHHYSSIKLGEQVNF